MNRSRAQLLPRGLVAAGTVLFALVLLSVDAAAHIEPTTPEGPAGGELTTAFQVGHGCNGAPTTKIEVKIPAGVTNVVPAEVPGFSVSTTTRAAGEVDTVIWDGGNLPSGQSAEFGLTMRLPQGSPGERLFFPVIQTCDSKTQEWITPAREGEPEPEFPAPYVTLGAALTQDTATTTTSSEPPATTTSAKSGSGNTAALVVVGAVVLALVVGAVVLVRSRSRAQR